MVTKKSKANVHKKASKKPKSVKKNVKKSERQKKVSKPVVKKSTRTTKAKAKTKPVSKKKEIAKPKAQAAEVPAVKSAKSMESGLPSTAQPKPLPKPLRPKTKVKVKPSSYTPLTSNERRTLRNSPQQFTYMKAPVLEHEFQVGDTVEVFCDHEKSGDRVRGWVKGTVVQVDNKLVAVQFRSNVFLTDGWMVPDRILWYPLTSDQIRALASGRRSSQRELPDY